MGTDKIRQASAAIFDKIISLDAFARADTVMTYVSFGSEIDTHAFINALMRMGKTVATPVCRPQRRLTAALTKQFPEGFAQNRFGILEIPQERADAVEAGELDIVIVPCVAYAADGYRLGYGGGYYDRFLPQLREDALTIGVVMDELLLDKVPVDVYDVRTKIVVTQSRCCFTGGDQWE
jgi:5-formyltetrahydrofolate cyclo-ligase